MKTCDIAIVGAGIIGLSIAWQIARRSNVNVVVLEKGAGVGEGSTGASSAICRCRYSLDEMVALARDSIGLYRNWAQFISLTEPRAQLNADGILWLPCDDGTWADREHARLQQMDVATQVLDDQALTERFPAINPCVQAPDLVTGEAHECQGGGRHLLETEGGWVDPVSAAQDLVQACRAAGVEVRFRATVSRIDKTGDRVAGLALDNGETLACPLVVNAAGPWCRELFTMADLTTHWDLAPIRIQVMHRQWPTELGRLPVTCDLAGGIYFRGQNQGQQILVSTIAPEDEREEVASPDQLNRCHDQAFELAKMHALHHRIPDLPSTGPIRGYCGLYTMNRDDVHPIVGPTSVDGFWVANGFSGHGFKLAPAIGALVAREITGTTLDDDTRESASIFSIDRPHIQVANPSVLA